ncbi:MAG: hypothetical protein JXX29_14035 [Deltaproteobacteria bacterium]|nr:hypothetical protein [Deltaproteobacteria bacterium]MBN2672797.1 hypothetical protein [Deltaproteobacteria bacterium]
MARTKEYQSRGGAYKKLEDALSTIDNLLEEVKKAGSESTIVHSEVRALRNVVGRLQGLFQENLASLREKWRDMGLDPVVFLSQEHISDTKYVNRIQMMHPVYDHVWVTDMHGNDLGEELMPHIVLEATYIHKQGKVVVNVQLLDVQLNLPEFKTSLEAAHMDLEIVRHDAKHVEQVTEFGNVAKRKLTEALTAFCEQSELSIEVNEFSVEEIISSGVFSERKRAMKPVIEEARSVPEEDNEESRQRAREEKEAEEAKRARAEERKRKVAAQKAERELRQKEQEQQQKEAIEAASAKPEKPSAAPQTPSYSEPAVVAARGSEPPPLPNTVQTHAPSNPPAAPPRVSQPPVPPIAAPVAHAPSVPPAGPPSRPSTPDVAAATVSFAPPPIASLQQNVVPSAAPLRKPTDPIY